VFGQHVHIGCRSGDDAMYLLHALNRYVPALHRAVGLLALRAGRTTPASIRRA
jgi:gamma-glutamyl:cysteine ligase YbdK (ATP-grasp superfamily)